MTTLATAFRARSAGSLGFLSILGAVGVLGGALIACSGGSTTGTGGDGGAGLGSRTGTSGSTGPGGATASGGSNSTGAPTVVNPRGSAPGEGCNAPSDCLIVYCDCTNRTVTNAQRCVNSVCQTPQSACPSACSAFGTSWSGTSDLEKPRSSSTGTSGSSGTSGTSGGTCASFSDCAPYTCTCLDGETISDQACIAGKCGDATTACDASCTNLGHGGAQ